MSPRARHIIAGVAIAAAGVASSVAARNTDQRHQIDVGQSTITIRVFKAGLLRGFADNHLIEAALADGWVQDSGVAGVDVSVDAQRLQVVDPDASPTSREQVRTRMLGPEVLDANRFPQIHFRSTAVQAVDTDRWLVRGALELHGQTHEVALDVVRDNGRYRGRTTLRQTDFGIRPVSVAGGAVKVKDELTVDLDIVTTDQ